MNSLKKMNLRNKTILIGLFYLLWGCSSTKLMDSWRSKNFDSIANSKILVITRAPKGDIRVSFEIAIANELRAMNIEAIESHLQFPSLRLDRKVKDRQRSVELIKEAGIHTVLLTSLKQTIETQNELKDAQTGIGIEEMYEDKRGFMPAATELGRDSINISTTYILEALTYNLALEEDEQLVNVCLIDVTDPDSQDKVRKAFIKIVCGQFK